MKFYALVIVISAGIICAANCLFTSAAVWLCVVLTVSAVIGLVILHGAGSAFIYSLRKHINPKSKYFNVSRKEKRFWEFFGVRKFKDYLPDLGAAFVGFAKGKIAEPKDIKYLEKYIHETCVGEIGHIAGACLGYLIMLCMPVNNFWLYIALPCAVVNMFLAIMPMIAMRYNRYKLTGLLKIVEMQVKKSERHEKQGDSVSDT